ncbi:MoaD/ThiS family protein [Corynebacterium sp. TAE3-ERU12]|uniref:sulfur carrier protein ThiS n=1 Tax=Corynebacterium sp. TAE3-ERU12 TaxID=2849491 RepID=UPI002102844F|nr:MoaD/ThiS family protein [Corynebacterium sp. TAE3-ERU12]
MTTINGSAHNGPENTILEVVMTWTNRELNDDGTPTDGGRLGIAVAVNGAVVPRSRWFDTPAQGEIDIVTAVQGG